MSEPTLPEADIVATDIDRLVAAANELDAWLLAGGFDVESTLYSWHVVEILCDLRTTEARLARLRDCRDRDRAQAELEEHCADVLDYLVPHWPLHLRPLRENTAALFGAPRGPGAPQPSGSAGAPAPPETGPFPHEHGAPVAGTDLVRAACEAFGEWLDGTGELDFSVRDSLVSFASALREVHEVLYRACSTRRLEDLSAVMTAACDEIEQRTLSRMRDGATPIRDWVRLRSEDSDDAADTPPQEPERGSRE